MAVAEEKVEGCITASTVYDLYYLLRKHLHDHERTRQTLLGLITSVNILNVTDMDCERAFTLPLPDYEEALLACCGQRHKADYIVTRDPNHFKGSPVKVIEPDTLLQQL